MDISTITDVKELKALAFDAIQAIEVQQANLRALQQRIAQLESNDEIAEQGQ